MYKLLSMIPSPSPSWDPTLGPAQVHIPRGAWVGLAITGLIVIVFAAITSGKSSDS